MPGNSSLVKQLAADLTAQIKYNTRVAQLKWTDAKQEWLLIDDKGLVRYYLPFIVNTIDVTNIRHVSKETVI